MYVKGHFVRKTTTSIMVNIGVTHNFISKGEVKKFSLKLEKDLGCMKDVKSKAFNTKGVVK